MESGPTARKAKIKRASQFAQDQIDQLDSDTINELARSYEQARDDIKQQIESAGDTVRREQLQQLLNNVNSRLNQLYVSRNELLTDKMVAAARLGVEPVIDEPINVDLGGIAEDAVLFVQNFIADDGLQLSDRLWRIDNHAREIIGTAIQSAVIQGTSASEAAQSFLSRGESIPFDVQQKLKKAKSSSIADEVGKLLMTGEGNPYNNVLRVFRTEINRAHNKAYEESVFELDDTAGTRFLLSHLHPRPDICDMHANINRYGLGNGVYPKGKNPYPAHPNTLSFIEVVFTDEVDDIDRKTKEDPIAWLKRQSGTTQEQILGRKKRAALEAGLLKTNQITTPWKILKVRFEKKGINTNNLNVAPVPLDLAQPKTFATLGAPVSGALQAKAFKRETDRVLKAIDSVHGDGDLPVIEIVKSRKRKSFGSYRYMTNGRAIDIEIRSSGEHKELTLVHEIGHFIDHQAFGSKDFSSTHDSDFNDWRESVAKSKAIKGLVSLFRGPRRIDGLTVPKKHLKYLLETEELWARSYSQYIAIRSGDEFLLEQTKAEIDARKRSPIPIMTQWDEDDFQPIADAMDRLFIKKGWLK